MFCPKLLAGIGQLPDTISDRSIVLPMKRKTTAESVERFRYAYAELQAKPLRADTTNTGVRLGAEIINSITGLITHLRR